NHPLINFFKNPENLDNALQLDDTVIWGSLPMLLEAPDKSLSSIAKHLHARNLFKCIDIRQKVTANHPLKPTMTSDDRAHREAQITIEIKNIINKLKQFSNQRSRTNGSPILIDESKRLPYKKDEETQNPLNQILIKQENNTEDMARL